MTDQSVIMPNAAEPDKKQRILDCARRLLIRRGFQDLAMDDVAREAAVAKGTLFLYYRSKDELFTAVYADLVDQLGATFDALLGSGERGDALLRRTVEAILSYFDRNRDFMANLGVGRFPACGARSCEKLVEKFRENHRRVARLLALALPGTRRADGVSYETSALFGLCRAAMMEKLMTKASRPLAEESGKVAAFFMKGAGGRP